MANHLAIFSVGAALVEALGRAFPPALAQKYPCQFRQICGGELADPNPPDRSVTLFLHRATLNESLRNLGRFEDGGAAPPPLTVDLHYLLTFWHDNPEAEQVLMAWTLARLNRLRLLDASILSAAALWRPEDLVQFLPAEISNEEMQRLWGDIRHDYRPSLTYVARGVRIDADEPPDDPGAPVVTRRQRHGPYEFPDDGDPT